MSDTSFGPASDPGPQHPRGSGMSRQPNQRGYMDQASDMADDVRRAGKDYYEQGSRRVSEWANEHPDQLWAAIAVAGAFALRMAYRPVFSPRSRANFDPSRYRQSRRPRPAGRAPFVEDGAASATSRRGN